MKIKLMPSSPEIDMEGLEKKVKESMPDYARLTKTEIAPIAFGLKALVINVIIPDQSPDELLAILQNIEGVENVDVEDLSLM
ncbi:MAG: elongation factor 1-beta [Thermoplasmata archaeon]|nr:elongation factor 1-beta [Thermoplasmata archaeon]